MDSGFWFGLYIGLAVGLSGGVLVSRYLGYFVIKLPTRKAK